MFKNLLSRLLLLVAFAGWDEVQAQDSLTMTVPGDPASQHCAVTHAYLKTKDVTSPEAAILPIPSGFPSFAIVSCGHFTLYYEDVAHSLGRGYDAPAGIGALRRENLCKVLEYIESVFDFSQVGPGAIRLHIDSTIVTSDGKKSRGAPFYKIPITPAHPVVNGYVADFIRTGRDDAEWNEYHGELRMDMSPIPGATWEYNSDYRVTAFCGMDLFTTELHMLSHVLGLISWIEAPSGNYMTSGPVSSIDLGLFTTPNPALPATINPFSSTNLVPFINTGSFTFSPVSVLSDRQFWVNGRQPPYNFPMTQPSSFAYDQMIHYDDFRSYGRATRLSPGEHELIVAQPEPIIYSMFRRAFSKTELETFTNIIGYRYNTSYATAHSTVIANTRPYSTKMNSNTYNHLYTRPDAPEKLPADFTITNNTGTSLTIDLTTDATLFDANGDPISIFPGSLANMRGCGEGFNNHNLLSVNPAGTQITYTPRANFYGRAQFGFNLFDGKEKGGYVLYTIEVKKGNNVSVPAFGNLVLNGSFEEGSEVRVMGSVASETINNSLLLDHNHEGRLGIGVGQQLGDSHPYDALNYWLGVMIRNSNPSDTYCAATATYTAWGSSDHTFPAPWKLPSIVYPFPPNPAEHRYQSIQTTGFLMYMGDTLQPCKRYMLEFYARKTWSAGSPVKDVIRFGFTDDASLAISPLAGDLSATILKYNPTATTPAYQALNTTEWKKVKLPFNYCGSGAVNILYLDIAGNPGLTPATVIIDSVSVKEVPFTVTAIARFPGGCLRTLVANPDEAESYSCAASGLVTYTWTAPGMGVVGTGKEITVEPWKTTTYTVTADDGCGHTATATVTVTPCPCAPSVVFGSDAITRFTTPSSIPASVPAGLYNITSDITISVNTTITGANILVNPGVTITVSSNAKLILDNCHLFVCADSNKLWKGIVLQSTSLSSARIEVKNNSLIEDAEIAISAVNPRIPGSGDAVSSTNSTYNRNQIDIYIDNLTAMAPLKLPFTINGNVFTSRLFTKTSYAGYPNAWPTAKSLKTYAADGTKPSYVVSRNYTKAVCKNGVFSNSGLLLSRLGNYDAGSGNYSGISVGAVTDGDLDFNLFDNRGYGINAAQSNVTVYNNHFINIGETMAPAAFILSGTTRYATSAAIYAANPALFIPTSNRLLVTPPAVSQTTANVFHDCIRGVSANGYAVVKVTNANMTSSHVIGGPAIGTTLTSSTESGCGIVVASSSITNNLLIDKNDISNIVSGVNLNLTTTAPTITAAVTNNKFSSANPALSTSLTGSQKMTEAVYAYANAMLFTTATTGNLQINGNTMNRVIDGIRVANISQLKPEASNNAISMWDRSPGTGVMQYGIYFTQTKGGTISGNTINEYTGTPAADITRAVLATFNTSLKVCTNTENALGRGFDFAQLTPQAGTIWVGNTMSQNSKGFVLGSDIGHQSISSSGPFSFAGTSQNKWTGSWLGARVQTSVEGPTSLMSTNSKLYIRNITTGAIELPSANQATIAANRYLNTGSSSGSLIVSQASQLNCTGNIFGKPFPLFFGDVVWSIMGDNLGAYRPNQWMAQYSLWQEGLSNDELATSSPEFNQFMNAASTTRFKWLTDIETALTNEDVPAAQNLLNSPQAAAGTLQVAAGVTVTDVADADYVVNHYLDYYNLYIKYLLGTLDSNDQVALAALANLCPAVDGGAVYQARSLLQTLTGDFVDYHDDSCMYGMSRLVGSAVDAQQQSYILSPNPNNGRLLLRQQLTDDQPVAMSIYDIQGRIVMRSMLNFGKMRQQAVTMGAVVPGMYLLHLQDHAGKSYTIKFNVQ